MHKQQFKISINAPKEVVWNSLWEDASYREWTSAFTPDSHAVTDWKKGSKILFLDGSDDGMVSQVADRRDNEYMSIQHIGIIQKGVEILDAPETKDWQGFENYTLKTVNGKTEVVVELQFNHIKEEYLYHFNEAFPKALEILKQISERRVKETV